MTETARRYTADTINDDELDSLYAERDRLRSTCKDVQRFLGVLYASLPGGLDVYLQRIKAARLRIGRALADTEADS